jgi:hypothetical protein
VKKNHADQAPLFDAAPAIDAAAAAFRDKEKQRRARKEPPTVTWRAIFEQPRGHLNRSGYKIGGQHTVELYQLTKTGPWYARMLGPEPTRHGRPAGAGGQIQNSTSGPLLGMTAGYLQLQVNELFARRVGEWRRFDNGRPAPIAEGGTNDAA